MGEYVERNHGEEGSILMSLALDGLLDADGTQQLERHLATCPSCQGEWVAMQQVSALFEQSPMVGPPLGFAVRVERRLEEEANRRRRLFGGMAFLTSSLSLAGAAAAVVILIIAGILVWQWMGGLPAIQGGTEALSQVASGVGLMGKGASLFLKDLLLRYGPPFILVLGAVLSVLMGIWIWLLVKRPGSSRHNGFA